MYAREPSYSLQACLLYSSLYVLLMLAKKIPNSLLYHAAKHTVHVHMLANVTTLNAFEC